MFTEKLKYGSDNMHDYVGSAVMIESEKNIEVNERLKKLEDNFKSQQMKGKELKGKDILKGKMFKYGIVSMKPKEVKFYTDLLKLLNEENVLPCIYIINKMSYLVSAKLRDWILLVSDFEHISPYKLKFILTGYLEIEGTPEDIKALLGEDTKVYHLLKAISKNLKTFIKNNRYNGRMSDSQIPRYEQMLKYINEYKNVNSNNAGYSAPHFNWQVISQMFDLWLSEIIYKSDNAQNEKIDVYLDEGIKPSIFSKIELVDHVYGDQNSNEVPGIRIADYLAVMYGKLLQLLVENSQYDRKHPQTQKMIDPNFFHLHNKEQFNLIKILYKIIFDNGYHYSVMRDCHYKDAERLKSYLSYFNNFDSFEQYHNISGRL